MSVCYNCPNKPLDRPCPHHLHRLTCPKWADEQTKIEATRQAQATQNDFADYVRGSKYKNFTKKLRRWQNFQATGHKG